MGIALEALLSAVPPIGRSGPVDISITSLEYDSRRVGPGSLFFAFRGLHADGSRFITDAIRRGAAAIVCDTEPPERQPGIAYLLYPDSRLAMSPISAAFYGYPSRSLCVIGVTGTEGKSTTVSLIYQLLNLCGRRAGHISTVTSDSGEGQKPNPEHQTTPEATTIHRNLAAMRDAGLEYAVLESSSHGLSPRTGRLADVEFDIAVLTNVTHEHLEFHGTWEAYRDDKANLFRALDRNAHGKTILGESHTLSSVGIVNADDPSAAYFAASNSKPSIGFSASGRPCEYFATDIETDPHGSDFSLHGPDGRSVQVRIDLPGKFNVGNALAALAAAATCTGLPWTDLAPLLGRLGPVRGRMMRIDRGQPFDVVIDYAHTPSSFETVLAPLRAPGRTPGRAPGRILCLFGSAGERDRIKRPEQGRIAEKYADVVILTDEDPRAEEPMAILEEIASGIAGLQRETSLFLIPDRPAAIRKAFGLARPGDLVLLLGKGHENSIIYADRTIAYDEEKEALQALGELGYRSSDSVSEKDTP